MTGLKYKQAEEEEHLPKITKITAPPGSELAGLKIIPQMKGAEAKTERLAVETAQRFVNVFESVGAQNILPENSEFKKMGIFKTGTSV